MLSRIKPYWGIIGFITVIGVIALLFHYPVRIVDALNNEPVPGFDIIISAWRVIFEPLFGPLLFYLRADQPLLEFTILLVWILCLFLIISFCRIAINRDHKGGKAFLGGILTWLKKIPLIVSAWLGLLWFIIFIWFPANTIVNNTENAILINTHSHSEHSHDGIISQARLQKWHKRNGFDAFFITDHNHHERTLEAVKAQEAGEFPREPLIIGGEEFSGSNHMTLLGLTRNFSTQGLSDQQVIDLTHEDNGIVIVAHWFDGERKSIPYFTKMGVDGFEIANQATGLSYDRRIFQDIVDVCTDRGLIMNGAADYHGYGSPCFVWNALEIDGWHGSDMDRQRESILNLLRQKETNKIRVLLYNDRFVFNRSYAVLSPVYTLASYFRTLNSIQFLSWIIWLVIIRTITIRLSGRKKQGSLPTTLEIVSFAGSVYLLVFGIILYSKAGDLTATNEIYSEYGNIMFLSGAGFLIYSTVIYLLRLKRNPSIKNQT